jgi:hypothetical protein
LHHSGDSCNTAESRSRAPCASDGVRQSKTEDIQSGGGAAASRRHTSYSSATGRRSSMPDSHMAGQAEAICRGSHAVAPGGSRDQPVDADEPAAADEVSWALNDAAIPEPSVFQPQPGAHQHLQSDARVTEHQQAVPQASGDEAASIGGVEPTAADLEAADGAANTVESAPSSAGNPADGQDAAEAVQSSPHGSWTFDADDAAAEFAEAAAADEMLLADWMVPAGERTLDAADELSEEMEAGAADRSVAGPTEFADGETPATPTAAAADNAAQSWLDKFQAHEPPDILATIPSALASST